MPHFQFPAFLCCVIVIIFWIRYETRKSSHQEQTESESFWKREQRASFSRKKDLSSLNYITVPVNELPFGALKSEEAFLMEERLRDLSQKKIVNLTGISNTQLKIDYGAANLDFLMEYDQNFTLLARTLNQWARLMEQAGLWKEAKTILEFAIACKTDVTDSYLCLAAIYQEEGQPEKINRLMDQAETIQSLSKNRILQGLMEILNQ